MSGNQFIEEGDVEMPKKAAAGSKKSSAWSQILNGEFLTKDFVLNNLGYILFFFFLLFIFPRERFYANENPFGASTHRTFKKI